MPKGPSGYHFRYINRRFVLVPHGCSKDCGFNAIGCTQHWRWKDGVPLPLNNGDSGWDYSTIDYQMYYFSAYYQGSSPKPTKQQRFHTYYKDIVNWIKELDVTTIFCDWDDETIAEIFDKVKNIFAGHTVPTTKVLYFFIPDLFIILDRKQVWKPLRKECAVTSILPSRIDDMDGRFYVELLKYVRNKISYSIKSGIALNFNNKQSITVKNIDQLRLVTPLQIDAPQNVGHTLGKVIDNLVRLKE